MEDPPLPSRKSYVMQGIPQKDNNCRDLDRSDSKEVRDLVVPDRPEEGIPDASARQPYGQIRMRDGSRKILEHRKGHST